MSRASRELIGNALNQGIQQGFANYRKNQEEQQIQSIINNPDATPMQKALAISKKNPKLASDIFREEQRQNNLQQLNSSIQNQLGLGTTVPQNASRNATNPSQLMPGGEIPEANQGGGQNQPQVANAPQPMDPIQELERQEQIYRQAADQAGNFGLTEKSREYLSQADALQRKALAQQKLNVQQQQFEQTQQFKIHEKQIPRVNKLREQAENAKNRLQEYGDIEEDLRSGKMSPFSFKNFVANKYKGTQIEGLFSSAEREKQKAFSVRMFEGMKEMFGGQLTDAKLGVISGKIIDPSKTPKANQAIIDLNKFYDEQKNREYEIGNEIIKSNGGYIPINFDQQVQDIMEKEYGLEAKKKVNLAASDGITDQDTVMMRNPKDGKIYPMPSERITKALAQGGVIISNE